MIAVRYTICCANCGDLGTTQDIGGANGWRLAANRVAQYTCGPACDDRLRTRDAARAQIRNPPSADEE